jgi:hypothetical protein
MTAMLLTDIKKQIRPLSGAEEAPELQDILTSEGTYPLFTPVGLEDGAAKLQQYLQDKHCVKSSDPCNEKTEDKNKMQKMFEAVWNQGKIIPQETVSIRDQTRLLIVVPDEQSEKIKTSGWQHLKGKYRGRLSSADEFIRLKQEEKEIEK